MKHTLDEMMSWGACNLDQVKTAFQLGKRYSLRESSRQLSFDEVWWFLIEKAKRDPETLARLRTFVQGQGASVEDGATPFHIGVALYHRTVIAVRKLNAQGMGTESAYRQVKQDQLRALLPIFDDPDDNVQA